MITNSLKQMIVNSPVRVNFAGLRGTTVSLQNSGWELAVECYHSEMTRDYKVRLTGRNQHLQLYFYSGIAIFDAYSVMNRSGDIINPAEHIEFPIRACAQALMINIAEPSKMPSYSAVDFSSPFNVPVDTMNVSLEDLVPFRGFNGDAEIYLPEKKILSVQEYLNEILGDQREKQKEIRDKKRRMKSGNAHVDFYKKSSDDIKLQLVAI